MLAFGLSILLFLFWATIGYALLVAFHRQNDSLSNLLLAPALGTATTLLPVFWLNRLGIPVSVLGIPVAIVLLAISAILLWRFRPPIPWQHYLPFLLLFFIALLLTGRPMLEFGLNWVSYANDDMANYSLAAHLFLDRGFFDVPDADHLLTGKDYSLFYWFIYVPGGVRPGSDLLLAWVCSITKLTAHQIFMPTILALHLTLISVTGGVVNQITSSKLAAWFSCLLLSFSALTSLGALYQLIAQVYGLGLLVGCIAFIPFVFSKGSFDNKESFNISFLRSIPKRIDLFIVPASLLFSALLIVYPEVLPFLALTFLVYALISIVQKQFHSKAVLIHLGLILIISLVLINTYLPNSISFLIGQSTGGLGNTSSEAPVSDTPANSFLFPYYLVPNGLAALWGFQNMVIGAPSVIGASNEPFLSISIFLGAMLLFVVLIATILLIRCCNPISITTSVMLCLAFILFLRRSDFGLFKLAMFIQPFMLSTLVIFWFGVTKNLSVPKSFRIPIQIAPLIIISLLNLPAQQLGYVEASRGLGTTTLIEIPNASESAINNDFKRIINDPSTQASQNVVLDTSNVVLAKFQSLYARGRKTLFLSRNFFFRLSNLRMISRSPSVIESTTYLQGRIKGEMFSQLSFDMLDPVSVEKNIFFVPQRFKEVTQQPDNVLISTIGNQDVFNRRSERSSDSNNFEVMPIENVKNHLVFIDSQLGQHYYLGDPRRISFYQPEPDWFLPGRTMISVGRHFLFQIINPTPSVRLILNVTASLNSDAKNQLPPASIIGKERINMGVVGRGSARIFSPPLSPQIIDNNSYLGVDMGAEGKLFPEKRKGLMRLYGTDIPGDRRKLVGFARDISLISEQDYASLNPPTYLDKFPEHLTNPDLEYSGLYEDGWASEAAFVGLNQQNLSQLKIAGQIPLINDPRFTTQLAVLLDGQEIGRETLGVGDFKLNFSVPPTSKRCRVELRFSQLQSLTAPDGRPTAVLLKFLGFTNSSS